MFSAEPLVSINICTYNREQVLRRCLDSVFQQSYGNMEIIIVDDCSDDDTEVVISEYMRKDPRIKYIRHNKNKKLASARNTAWLNSKGKYIAFMDDDDEWIDQDKISKQVSLFEKSSDQKLGFICSSVRVYNDSKTFKDKIITKPKDLESIILTKNGIIYTSTGFTKKSIVEKVGGFDVVLRRGIDSDFYRKVIVKYGYNVHFMPDLTVAAHEYGNDRITTNDERKLLNQLRGKRKRLRIFSEEFKKYPCAHCEVLLQISSIYFKLGKYRSFLSYLIRSYSIAESKLGFFRKLFKPILRFVPCSVRKYLKTVNRAYSWRKQYLIRYLKERLYALFNKESSVKVDRPTVVYMTGMPRTGTSLMKNYFGDHFEIEVLPFQKKGFYAAWKKAKDNDKVILDKSTHYIRNLGPVIRATAGRAAFCCIVRDPRDQLVSLMEFDRHPEIPRSVGFWIKWVKQYTTFLRTAEKYDNIKFYLIRYEDLVHYPAAAKRSFLEWIHFEANSELSEKYKIAHLDDIQDDKVVLNNCFSSQSIGRYVDISDPRRRRIIESFVKMNKVKNLMRAFGYYETDSMQRNFKNVNIFLPEIAKKVCLNEK